MAFALLDRCSTNCLQRWFVPLVLASTLLVVRSAKLLVARPRPTLLEALIALPADDSYPSAHAAQITAIACAWLLRPGYRASLPVTTLLIAGVPTVALSRLYLQVYYLSDVMYGMVASALWVAALRSRHGHG